ncbi:MULTISPECIES: hypothetical protein [unclassified Pseudovibrio]|uniref:hypothetical protein n=1 Tax=unclassified Pseudovibrio TaxID=2627060 RepID=UPI0007AEB5CC|nr:MULTISPECIES: hypothetical protein [unclassified Pseudovibrio]KZK85753.1 hypothetical protein PsAD46_03344 [Pseudovibrio sp. Ad46]KZL10694.1 hypothetical protein PsAD26_03059 [Pseudovibrio sp. Ad26]
MPLAEIKGFLTSVKVASDLLKLGIEARDDAKIKAASNELTERLIEANMLALDITNKMHEQDSHLRDAQERIRELEAKRELLDRYQLIELDEGSLVYELKANAGTEEPHHYACPNCLEDGRKTVLQKKNRPYSDRIRKEVPRLVCTKCPADFAFDGEKMPKSSYHGGQVVY